MKTAVFLGLFLGMPGILLADGSVCAPDGTAPVIGNTNAVLNYLEDKIPNKNPDRKEFLVERDIRYSGLSIDRVFLEIKLPETDTVIGNIILKEHQSYRGLEVVSINTKEATLRDREGKLIKITPGDTNWVKVLVAGERRDQYNGLLSAAKSITFTDYRRNIWELEGVGTGIPHEVGLLESPGGLSFDQVVSQNPWAYKNVTDERGVIGVSKDTIDCAAYIKKNPTARAEIPIDTGQSEIFFYSCKTESGKMGVCCNSGCEEKIQLSSALQTLEENCGPITDECGDELASPTSAFVGKKCAFKSQDGSTVTGTCSAGGACRPCYQRADRCKLAIGEFINGSCTYDDVPEGALCDEDKICLAHQCVSFKSISPTDLLRASDATRAVIAHTTNQNEINEIAAILDSTLSADCSNLSIPNGDTCSLHKGKTYLDHCFDGQCIECDPNSDLKFANADPCPQSIQWPDKKGKRRSCGEPDICVYE